MKLHEALYPLSEASTDPLHELHNTHKTVRQLKSQIRNENDVTYVVPKRNSAEGKEDRKKSCYSDGTNATSSSRF